MKHRFNAFLSLGILAQGVMAMDMDALVFVGRAADLEGNPATAVFSIDADGSNRRQITRMLDNANRIQSPSVSPLGRKLVYFRWPRLHVCDWDGANDVCVTPVGREHFQPAWSPDGQSIAFASDRDDDAEIYRIDADGANPRNLTWRGLAGDISPAWSPDGQRIAFASNRGGRFAIHVMDRQGRGPRAITDGSFDCHAPAWSPDGRRIAFAGERNGLFDLHLIDADGGGLLRLTENAGWNGQPAWSPGGTHLAFVSTRGGNGDIWIMDLATREVRNLTGTPDEDERFPAWVPRQLAKTPLSIPAADPASARNLPPFQAGLLASGVSVTAAPVGATALPRPRLMFRSEDLPGLREKLGLEPRATAWTAFLQRCEPHLDMGKPPMPDALRKLAENAAAAREPLSMAFNLGFAYQVTGDPRYGEAGARLLAETCRELREHHPLLALDWPLGPAEYLPAAFDWLHPALSEDQRRVVRAVLLVSTERLYRHAQQSAVGFSPMAEAASTANNMMLVTAGYLGPGALALAGEPGSDSRWLDAAVHMLQRVVETWYDEHGSTVCGHAYFTWAGGMAVPFLMSCARNGLGDDLAGQNIRHWPTWMAMTACNGLTRTINMGDSDAGPPAFHVAYLDLYRDNPLVDLLWARSGVASEPKPEVADLLWWRAVDADPKAVDALPASLFFPNGGYAVFRAGFEPDSPMLTFSAPRHGGHAHAEGGAFCLYGYGMDFAVEAGNGNPSAQAHNNVLVNGRGRAHPWKEPEQPVVVLDDPGDLGAGATADFADLFATSYDGHGAYAYPSSWYPIRKALRHVAMVHHAADGVPPYFLIADDMDANGATNRYDFLLTGQRDTRVETSDHEVFMRPAYRGVWFEAGEAGSEDAVTFEVDVPATGVYHVWLYVKDAKSQYRLAIGGHDVTGLAVAEATRSQCWQWQRFIVGKAGEGKPVALDLPKGRQTLAMRHTPARYAGNFAQILLTPSADFEPWEPDAADAPSGSILVPGADARAVGAAWTRHAAEPPETEPRATFTFLNPEPLTLALGTFSYRTRHFGRVLIRLPRVTATREAVNPRFLVLAYPHRANLEQPRIARGEREGVLTATVTWKQAVDTISWTENAPPEITRRLADGTLREVSLEP